MTVIALRQAALPDEFVRPPRNAPIVARPLAACSVPAGFPSPADDSVTGDLDPSSFLIKNPASTFLFTVRGDSMVGVHIADSDILVVDRSLDARHGSIVIATVDGEHTVKTFYRRGGVVELRPANPAYQPIRFGPESQLEIWGVVVGCFRRFGV